MGDGDTYNSDSERNAEADIATVRGIVNPLKTKLEMSQGKLRMKEHAVYNGSIKVSHAAPFKEKECTWLFLTAESRDGMNVTLTEDETRELRDLLNDVLELRKQRARDTGSDRNE